MSKQARGPGRGNKIGEKIQPAARFAHGDPEEIAQRDKAAYQPPDEVRFAQIPPGGHPGSFNDFIGGEDVGGHFKFKPNSGL